MIQTRITFNGSKVRLGPGIGFKKYQMLTLGQYALDRRRMRAWDAEWRATGPRWTGHYST